MNTKADHTPENKNKATAGTISKKPTGIPAKSNLQATVNNSPQIKRLNTYKKLADNSEQVKQLKSMDAIANSGSQKPMQAKWVRPPVAEEAQEAQENSAVNNFARGNDFMNAFRMHVSNEPVLATKFHQLTSLLSKAEKKNISDSVITALRETFTSGADVTSAEVIDAVVSKMPLDAASSVEAYTGKIKGIDMTSKDGTEKLAVLKGLFDEKFAALGIPPPTITLLAPGSGRNGEFDSTTWSFSLSNESLAKPVSDWAATAYHEARHAEQYFMMARHIVHEGITPPHSKQIPDNILDVARAHTPLVGEEKTKAEGFYNSVFGTHSVQRNQTLTKLGIYTQQCSNCFKYLRTE